MCSISVSSAAKNSARLQRRLSHRLVRFSSARQRRFLLVFRHWCFRFYSFSTINRSPRHLRECSPRSAARPRKHLRKKSPSFLVATFRVKSLLAQSPVQLSRLEVRSSVLNSHSFLALSLP